MTKPGILYVSYDGMLEPLGQSQVLAYLERLSGRYQIHLLSFEKAADWKRRDRVAQLRARIAGAGIRWLALRYHKAPSAPATAYDIAAGTLAALWLARRHDLRVVHARSYIPALIGFAVKRATGAKLLFDIRGFWADERVEAGIWPKQGRIYRAAKRLENRLFRDSDHIVTLTAASARHIRTYLYLQRAVPEITVIPTCVDLTLFRSSRPAGDRPFTFGFVGAASTWSCFDGMLRCFSAIQERIADARLLIVNRGEHDFIRGRLAAAGVAEQAVDLTCAEHSEVPPLMSRMDAGAAIRRPGFAQIACAPTKLGEYLACGVPCLVNEGVGDVVEIVEEDGVGIVLRQFSDQSIQIAMDELIALAHSPGIAERCRESASRRFSVEAGAEAYGRIYERLLQPSGQASAHG